MLNYNLSEMQVIKGPRYASRNTLHGCRRGVGA
jgi:hypothetical protein